MSVTVQKSGNVQGKTIKLEEQCTWTDYYTGEGMYRDRHKGKECSGTDIFTGKRNVQGQTISQGKGMFRDRPLLGNSFQICFKGMSFHSACF